MISLSYELVNLFLNMRNKSSGFYIDSNYKFSNKSKINISWDSNGKISIPIFCPACKERVDPISRTEWETNMRDSYPELKDVDLDTIERKAAEFLRKKNNIKYYIII